MDYKQVRLSNGIINLSIMLPDRDEGFYRSTRFDWSGMVGTLTHGKHSFVCPWILPHDPLGPKYGIGTAEESEDETKKE